MDVCPLKKINDDNAAAVMAIEAGLRINQKRLADNAPFPEAFTGMGNSFGADRRTATGRVNDILRDEIAAMKARLDDLCR